MMKQNKINRLQIVHYVIISIWIIGLLFKIMHWPGCNELLIISLFSAACVVALASFQIPKDSFLGLTARQTIMLNYGAYFSLAVLILGLLFKIMHWVGCNEMIIIGIGCLSIFSMIKGFLVQFSIQRIVTGNKALFKISGLVFFMGLSIAAMSSLFFLMHWAGSSVMQAIALLIAPLLIITYGFFKRNNIDLVGNHDRFVTLMVIVIASFVWLIEDRSVRLTTRDLNYGNMVHEKTLNYVKRGDRMLNAFSQRQKMGLSLSEFDKQKQSTMLQINEASIEAIKNIDQIKLLLLEKAGEDLYSIGENFLVASKYDNKSPMAPTSLNFYAIMSKNEFDTPMRELGIRDIDEIDRNGLGIQKLWKPFVAFQNQLLELCANYGEYKLSMPKNISISNEEELIEMLLKNKVKETELYALVDVYSDLAKEENTDNDYFGDSYQTHWLINNFDHTPMIKALAVLSDMQCDIAKARAHAFQLIYQRNN